MTMKFVDLRLDDRVRLRKPHPCGSYEWRVVRLGADIGLKCLGCGRRVLLSRSEVEKRIKMILERGVDTSVLPGANESAGPMIASDERHG
jgi:hypothetical protein